MGKRIIINSGERFGRWTVLFEREPAVYENGRTQRCFICKCDCGNVHKVRFNHLTSGASNGCGCMRGKSNFKHGFGNDRLYGIWKKMRRRCYSSSCEEYSFYGERGIKICQEWDDPIAFVNWALTHGYDKTLTIDRIDNNGNYTSLNCRWATMAVQSNNRRDNRYYEFNGKRMTIPDICRELNIWDKRLDLYYHVGYRGEDLLSRINSYNQ